MIDPYWKSRRLRNVINRTRNLTGMLIGALAYKHLAFTELEKKRMRHAAIRDLMRMEIDDGAEIHTRLAWELEASIKNSKKRREDCRGDLMAYCRYTASVVDEWPEWKRNILGNSGKSSVSVPRENRNEVDY